MTDSSWADSIVKSESKRRRSSVKKMPRTQTNSPKRAESLKNKGTKYLKK
jgi:hypothetical protein